MTSSASLMTSARTGRLFLGWQYATPYPEPGPPPRRPTPPEQERLNPDWAAAQRREESLLNRPLRAVFGIAVALGLTAIVLGAGGWLDVLVAGLGAICCALIAAVSGYAVWQGERALRSRLADERARVGKIRAAQESRLFAWQAEHATRMREWQALRAAYEHQKRWYAVCLPDGVHRVDIAGGTLSGWSAMLTTAGAHRLAAGGEVTVLDLTEGSVALDLIGFARASGVDPLVWVLPDDLPRLDLGTGLGRDALADLLSQTASVTEEQGSARDLSLDNAILERVIDVLAENSQRQATVAAVAAGLRALAQAGDPRDDVAAGTDHGRAGGPAGRHVRPRRHRPRGPRTGLDPGVPAAQAGAGRHRAGTAAAQRAARGRAGPAGGRRGEQGARDLPGGGADPPAARHASGAALAAHAVRARRGQAARRCARPAQRRVRAVGDRARAGLSRPPPHVRQRLGRGNAAVAFMRLGNAEDAKAASEQLGTEHRFVLSQLTETIGVSVTDTTSSAYTSTTGSVSSTASSWSQSEGLSRSTGHGHSDGSLLLPSRASFSRNAQTGDSRSSSESESVSASISASTAWGMTTSKATGDSESLALGLQRSREFLVEQHELQQLPASAMIITYAGPAGRQVVMADTNPGIGGLGAATQLTLEEFQRPAAPEPPRRGNRPATAAPAIVTPPVVTPRRAR